MKVHQLSKKALSVIKGYKQSQYLELTTRANQLSNAIAAIAIVPMLASVIMLFQSHEVERIVFAIFSVLLFLVSLCAWQYKKLLVLNNVSGTGYIETRFWSVSLKQENEFKLSKTEILIRPYPILNTVFLFSIRGHDYHVGSYANTEAIVEFISQEFALAAMDGVTDFPNKQPFTSSQFNNKNEPLSVDDLLNPKEIKSEKVKSASIKAPSLKNTTAFGQKYRRYPKSMVFGSLYEVVIALHIFCNFGFYSSTINEG